MKVTLNNVGSLIDATTAAATINSNFDTVETAFDNTLSRNGASPNQMLSSIDINGYKILNLPDADANGEAVNFQQFRNALISGGLGTININITPLSGGTSGGILFNNAGIISNTNGTTGSANLITSGTFTITPPVNSLTQGLNVIQVGPVGGSSAGPLFFNSTSSFFNSIITGNGTVSGLQVSVGTGASANAVEINGGSFGVTQTASGVIGEQVGITSGVEILAGLSTISNIYGAASATVVRVGSHTPQMTSHETDSFLFSALVPYRIGYNSGSFGDHNATTFESAYGVFTAGGSTNPWKNVIGLYTLAGTLSSPVATDANFFSAETAITMSRILDLRNITIGNFIIDSSKVKLSDGGLTLGTNATAGGFALNGPNGGAVFGSFQSNGTARWTYGITTVNDWAINDPENARLALLVSKSSGLTTLGYGLTVSGTVTLGSSTLALAGNTSLPAIVQGDLWYGSAAGTVSALAKSVSSNQFLKNSGTTNNPAWASIAASDITGLGTGVSTALAVNVGSADAFVTFNGALGSPSSAGTLPAYTLGGTISGGGNHINNVIIGTTTPLAGAFTTLSASSTLTVTGVSTLGDTTLSKANPTLAVNKAASGQDASLTGQTAGVNRWLFDLANNTAEAGANAGSDFDINRYSDAGSFLGKSLSIARSTGAITLETSISSPLYKSVTAPTAVSGAGPVAIGSASTINSRMKINLNGTDYWIPCSTTAF